MDSQILKLEFLMKKAGVTLEDRKVATAALQRAEETGTPAAAMENQVPEAEVKCHFDRLLQEVSEISTRKAKALEGKVMPVKMPLKYAVEMFCDRIIINYKYIRRKNYGYYC